MFSFDKMSVGTLLVVGLAALVAPAAVASMPTVTLEKAVHFLSPSGDDIVLSPGTYEVEATEQGLRLKPKDGKPEDAKVIQAQPRPYPETPDAPKAFAEPIGEDTLRLALFLPAGTGVEATGTYSGVRSRGSSVTCSVDHHNTSYGSSLDVCTYDIKDTSAFGYQALSRISVPPNSPKPAVQLNTGVGAYALVYATGSYNTAVGAEALRLNGTGSSNSAVGWMALKSNSSGIQNTAVGVGALYTNATTSGNTAVGASALSNNIAENNTAVGSHAMLMNTTGVYNTAVGSRALGGGLGPNQTSTQLIGSNNAALGTEALRYNTTGRDNTAVGALALLSNKGGNLNTAVGSDAMRLNESGLHNTAIGARALYWNKAASRNTALGFEVLHESTGGSNTAVGSQSLRKNVGGSFNTSIGTQALLENKSGEHNVAIGFEALLFSQHSNNTALGSGALRQLLSGGGNIAIGMAAGRTLTTGSSNVYLDNGGTSTESNTIRIGRSDAQFRAFMAGISGVAVSGVPVVVNAQGQLGVQGSSLRYKDDVQTMGEASQDLHKLRPVTFRYKPEIAGEKPEREYGLIAEEVAKVYPDLVGHDADGAIVTVKYHELIPMLLNEVQRLNKRVTDLESRQVEK